jgi:hypothetical protein
MNTKRILLFVTLCVAQVLTACGTTAPTITPEPVDPAAIAQEFYQALNDGDLEAAMALVADDIRQQGDLPITDKESFRSLLQTMIDSGERTEISNLKVEGDQATYDWELYSKDGVLVVRGVETLQLQDGLIILFETHAR